MYASAYLKLLEELESQMASLYEMFSKYLSDDVEAAKLFQRLRDEEISHRNIVSLQRRIAAKNKLTFDDSSLDVEQIKDTLRRVDRIIKSETPPSVEIALRVAVEFEDNASERHISRTFKPMGSEIEKMAISLGAEDKKHYEAILGFAKKRGISLP